jgi:parallel beta-helix repeat protein
MAVHGNHCTIENIYAHHNWNSGIYMTGSYGLISGCRAYMNSMMNVNATMRISWGFGISACRYPEHTIIRGCTSWENWGEGISTFESRYTTIEDCISYNNQCNFYLSDTQHCMFRRNLAYCTPGNEKQAYVIQANISLGDETRVPASSDNSVINTAAWGAERNFVAGGRELVNGLVAHNTFVNAVDVGGVDSTNVYFHAGIATGARFKNNIILQEDAVTISHLEAKDVAFGYNSWSRRPLSGCRGPGDVVGDPKILKSGPTGPGFLTPQWFQLSSISPALDRAEPLDEVKEDMVRLVRGAYPDMGALEAPVRLRPARPRWLAVFRLPRTAGSQWP